MGYLKERHAATLVARMPQGTCPECAVAHELWMPHDLDSLAYQYGFYDREGRWPTWEDAMAHCDDAVKDRWREALILEGVTLSGDRDA